LYLQVTFCKVNIVSGEGKFLPDERGLGSMERIKGKCGVAVHDAPPHLSAGLDV
jgi:hypothetical protein